MGNVASQLVCSKEDDLGCLQDACRARKAHVLLSIGGIDSALALPRMTQTPDGIVGRGTGNAVVDKAYARLELAQSMLGMRAKDAIGIPYDKPERVEDVLQAFDVMAVKEGHAKVKHAVSQGKRRIDERFPSGIIDKIPCRKALFLSKLAHGDLRSIQIDAVNV